MMRGIKLCQPSYIAAILTVLTLGSFCLCVSTTHAFSPSFLVRSNGKKDIKSVTKKVTIDSATTTAQMKGDNNDDEEDNPFDRTELTSTLARLDQQWKIQQKMSPQKSRWTKLVLPKDKNKQEDDGVDGGQKGSTAVNNVEDYVYLLEPPNNNVPSCLITFVGGAGLGQFPNVAYSEFLVRVSDRLNAAIITAPYTVGLDHFSLAKQTGERIRKAILLCEDDTSRLYPPSLPTYCIAHSLGCKLQTIYMAATGQQYEGVGFISFNNFSFARTISMARSFANQFKSQFKREGAPKDIFASGQDELLKTIFGFAENIIGAVGVDFSPSSTNTEKIINAKYTADLQRKTRLFVFDDDDLDSSEEFVQSCQGDGPIASGLPGTHLTPVYFKLGLDNVDLPEEAKGYAEEALGGFKSASFGNEENLNALVQEVCDWILGKGPLERQTWQQSPQEMPRITGMSSGSEV